MASLCIQADEFFCSVINRSKLGTYDLAHVESKRGDEEFEVPSHSPPGFTHTMESMRLDPVFVVGRVPKPAPLMLHLLFYEI